MNQNITSTIRFKLTLWYSLLLLFFAVTFVIFINMVVARFYQNEPPAPAPLLPRNPIMREHWENLSEIQQEIVQEIRREDLKKVRLISLYSLLPLTLLSFSGGYIISGQMLLPIKKLNRQMKTMTAKKLDTKIVHHDVGDEMSELINNFNKMTTRLNDSFELQKQFVENASHELKTPLSVIKTNLDAALMDTNIPKNELDKHIHASMKSIDFMDKLIEDLLLLSLLENQIKKEDVEILDIINDAKNQILTSRKQSNNSIQLNVSSRTRQLKLHANQVLLQRAIMNLLENAFKYSNQGDPVVIDVADNNNEIVISISDQGPGIPKDQQRKIFERFYRVDKSRSRKTGGSGLGLAITKKIIEAHNGIVTVRSTVGKGSIFEIHLRPDYIK